MGILYFYYVNNTYDALLLEIIKMINLKNMKICYPFKGCDKKFYLLLLPTKSF